MSSFLLYYNTYKEVAPSFRKVDFNYAKDIVGLGSKFFFIQFAVIIIYQTNNIIITQIASPKDVAIFNVAYRYLSIALMSFTIIISPYWSAFTEAYVQEDYTWMKTTVKALRKILFLFIIGLILLVTFSSTAYHLWLGDKIVIPFKITIAVGFYVLMLGIVGLHTQILNGIGKVRIQILTYSLATFAHIPLALFLGKKFDIIGVILSGSFFYLIISFFTVKQVNLLLEKKAVRIWNK